MILKKVKEKRKNKQKYLGFTLIELLAVIVILSILMLVAVPNVLKSIEKSRDVAFYTSVNNIVDSIKPLNITEGKDYCIFKYSDKENNSEIKTELIKEMYVLAHLDENNKTVYSVFAVSNKDKSIIAGDFNKVSQDTDTWNKNGASFYEYIAELLIDEDELNKQSICTLK